jgi:beta-mannosidase
MVAQMLDTFRLPKDFESLAYLSGVLQAEGIRYGVEHWRRYPQRVSGIIYWQLNDCWPVASWSSLDYFLRWKALHYAARRFYAPLMMSIEDTPTTQAVFITNEQRETWEGSVRWTLENLNGVVIKFGEEKAKVAPFDVAAVCKFDFAKEVMGDAQRDMVFTAELVKDGKVLARQVAYFVPTKHLNLSDPTLTKKVSQLENRLCIEVTAKKLARLMEVTIEGADVVFSDNYFDVPAGRTVALTTEMPEGWTLSQVEKTLKIKSVYDSFER